LSSFWLKGSWIAEFGDGDGCWKGLGEIPARGSTTGDGLTYSVVAGAGAGEAGGVCWIAARGVGLPSQLGLNISFIRLLGDSRPKSERLPCLKGVDGNSATPGVDMSSKSTA
jgi:hypothetical protein